ncbi:MAG: sodium:proton antiporter [Thermoguttaceae bacterium]|nr:sodium:proton antiporter [Thermoguttaceae bacterium]
MSEQTLQAPTSVNTKPVIWGLVVLFIVYVAALFAGIPQKWTAASNSHHAEAAVEQAAPTDAAAAEQTAPAEHAEVKAPPLWAAIPFCVLLLCIAVLPLIPATEHFWESNLHRFLVAAGLGLIVLLYYAFMHASPVELHWPAHSVVDGSLPKAGTIFVNAIIGEYISFIVLLFSLFTITGGIRISGDLKATPLLNSIILMIGAVLASFIGTTGAAMLLIRLLLDTNRERRYKVHTVIMFILAVCNCGGCLLPIGDPPLFLGYLRGVNFLWTMHLWPMWLLVNAILIGFYFLWDSLWFYRKETPLDKAIDDVAVQPLRIRGLCPNLFCLIGVVLAVMFLDPSKALGAADGAGGWYPPMFLREIVQLAMVFISLAFGSKAVRAENDFNFSAIIEVAALFFGIFICMQAPLQILNEKGKEIAESVHSVGGKLGLNEAQEFFWMSGSLSSVLDNAPTYVVFFETARAADAAKAAEDPDVKAELEAAEKVSGVPISIALLMAISLGSVMMGAMTYIGNGPNFMVKSIAEQSGIKMPSFFGYIGYTICILFPILLVMTLIFLR